MEGWTNITMLLGRAVLQHRMVEKNGGRQVIGLLPFQGRTRKTNTIQSLDFGTNIWNTSSNRLPQQFKHFRLLLCRFLVLLSKQGTQKSWIVYKPIGLLLKLNDRLPSRGAIHSKLNSGKKPWLFWSKLRNWFILGSFLTRDQIALSLKSFFLLK